MKDYNADLLSLEDLLEGLVIKGYSLDQIADMCDDALDELMDDTGDLFEDDDWETD